MQVPLVAGIWGELALERDCGFGGLGALPGLSISVWLAVGH